jgi:hypothetical protein
VLSLALAAEQNFTQWCSGSVGGRSYGREPLARGQTDYRTFRASPAAVKYTAAVQVVLLAGRPFQILQAVVCLIPVFVVYLLFPLRVRKEGTGHQSVHTRPLLPAF